MGEASGAERPRRVILPVAALVAVLTALGLGAAWTAAATGDRPGSEVDVAPVIDSGPLVSPSPSPAPDAPPVPVPAPQPVPAPPPADIDGDGDDDDDDGGDEGDDGGDDGDDGGDG